MSETTTNVAQAIEAITERNPFTLSNYADTYSPDGVESPGAKYLGKVRDAVVEAFEYDADDLLSESHYQDRISEIADSAVPIYTHDTWSIFVDLGAYREDVTDFGPITDMEKAASLALFMVAERLAYALVEEIQKAHTEDEGEDGVPDTEA